MLSPIRCILAITLVVGPASTAMADQPIQAPGDYATYTLSNVRKANDLFGRQVTQIDYKRTRPGKGHPQIIGRNGSSSGYFTGGFGANQDQGTLNLGTFGGFSSLDNIEIYLVASSGYSDPYLISNVLRIGNPGSNTSARGLNEQERKQDEERKKMATPPASLPFGHVAVTAATALVPGVLLKAGYRGEWADAEVVAISPSGRVSVLFDPKASGSSRPRISVLEREKWLAIAPAVAEKVKRSPESFSPSVRVEPGGTTIIPDELVHVPDDTKLPNGAVVKVLFLNDLRDGIVVADTGSSVKVSVRFGPSSQERSFDKSDMFIDGGILSKLDDPATLEQFAKQAEAMKSDHGRHTRHFRDYPVRINIPSDSELVPDDLELEPGAKLGACWGNRWYKMTLLQSNPDGTLFVRWDDYGTHWDCDMSRDQLIVAKSLVREAKRKAREAEDADNEVRSDEPGGGDVPKAAMAEKSELRTWTDRSGEFTLEAALQSVDDGEVTLIDESGGKIAIDLDQLSRADQKYVEEEIEARKKAATNPFKRR